MKDKSLWRMFCKTGDPVYYLIYRSAAREKEDSSDFPPVPNPAFSGTAGNPEVRL